MNFKIAWSTRLGGIHKIHRIQENNRNLLSSIEQQTQGQFLRKQANLVEGAMSNLYFSFGDENMQPSSGARVL
jgi:hypothetical protein